MKTRSECFVVPRLTPGDYLTRFAIVAVVVGGTIAAMPACGQDESEGATEAVVAEVNYTPPTVAELKAALAGEAGARYEVLTRVTPRGFAQAERAQLVQLLIPVLDDEHADIRSLAAQSLALFGPEARPAFEKLLAGLRDANPSRTPTTAASFEGVWVRVSQAIAAIGPEVLDELLAALPESNHLEYYGISAAISEMGTRAKRAAPAYIQILRSGPRERRWAAMYTLSKLGDAALPAIPDYIANLDDRSFNFQVIACRALAELGPASSAAAPKLVQLLEKGILSSRTHAAMCLGAIGPQEGVDSVALLSKIVQEPNAFCQERGMIGLGRLGPHAKRAAPLVVQLIGTETFSQQPEAARTLWQITGEAGPTIKILEKHIDHPTFDFRVYAVLKDMGPAAAPMAHHVVDRLKTSDQSLRMTMVEILAAMGGAAKEHVPALRDRLADSSREVVIALEKAIATIEAS